jgi:hypothetical protein
LAETGNQFIQDIFQPGLPGFFYAYGAGPCFAENSISVILRNCKVRIPPTLSTIKKEDMMKLSNCTSGTLLFLFPVLFLILGCQKESADMPHLFDEKTTAPAEVSFSGDGLASTTIWQLQQARAHTARYRKLENALKDGYVNINVVMPNMGHHYMKPELLDAEFSYKTPEILVYNKLSDGSHVLVAVEYAVPIPLMPNTAPDGFDGMNDVWTYHTGFNLWLLHAWVWMYNPEGVFNPTNPLVNTF